MANRQDREAAARRARALNREERATDQRAERAKLDQQIDTLRVKLAKATAEMKRRQEGRR